MKRQVWFVVFGLILVATGCCLLTIPCGVCITAKIGKAEEKPAKLTLSWGKITEAVGGSAASPLGRDFVIIHGAHLPGKQVRVRYLEAFCKANSTYTDWAKTQIAHQTELVSKSGDGQSLKLRSTLADGVNWRHGVLGRCLKHLG
jgi:hypothetical protein